MPTFLRSIRQRFEVPFKRRRNTTAAMALVENFVRIARSSRPCQFVDFDLAPGKLVSIKSDISSVTLELDDISIRLPRETAAGLARFVRIITSNRSGRP
jgi:hypothetical protein